MITIHLKYKIDHNQVDNFETYAKMWIPLVEKFAGIHHGYFLPDESSNHIAYALFSFESLTKYEQYRQQIKIDSNSQQAFEYATKTNCILHYERSFMRPLFKEEQAI